MKASITAIEPRQRTVETEKMTVNVGVVDLGHVDLLVQEGFYSNRSALVRTALRNQLARYADIVKQTVARQTLTSAFSTTAAPNSRWWWLQASSSRSRSSDSPALPTRRDA